MKKLTLAAVMAFIAGGVFAGQNLAESRNFCSPVGFSLAAPLQFPGMGDSVCGFRYNVFMAYNDDVYGLDLGTVGINTGDMKGLQINTFNWSNGKVDAFQISAFANVALDDVDALQIGTFNIVRGDMTGLQLGLVNVEDVFHGLQIGGFLNLNSADSCGAQIALANENIENFTGFSCGVINHARSGSGFQLGVVNAADRVTGFQLGVFNAANDMTGLQIGLVNLICEGTVPVMTVANANF